MITTITVGVIAATSIALFAFGANLLYLTWRATRLRPRTYDPAAVGAEPRVCVQIPIYNERYVAERVLDAVCELEWPRDRLEVQVLDDSDDETLSIVAKRVASWRRRGVSVTHVLRGTRDGFKAGALAHGLALTSAPFIAIFDADFIPPQDFLRRTLGVFDDPRVGFAQARWGHLDEGYSWFTRLQALAIDFHFLVEQAVRSSGGFFTNFTGTAGVWRRTAIEDSGGWSAATLTEDLDLSYRAQLRGWRAAYLEDLVVPEELPVSIDAYRRQQSRWATGSFQSAFKLLVPVVRSPIGPGVKFQACMHLLAYGVGPVMLVQLACYPFLLLTVVREALPWQLVDAAVLFVVIGVSPWIGFIVAQTRRGRPWWSGIPSLLCQLVGAGMSFTAILALFRATRRGGEFVRTPKHQIVERGQEWRHQAYVRVGDPRALGEVLLGAGALAIAPFAIAQGQWLVAIYSGLFALGFLTVAGLSVIEFLEVLTLRNLGRMALARLRIAAPAIGLIALCGLLLVAAAQMAEPFEDGYAHWLIAANLASTGALQDPLFGMQDTWLPAYHVLAAAVLDVFGLWQLGALKALSALLGIATLSCVYGIAPTARQGRLAVILLALNPVYLFTSGSAVVEPLLTALLAGAALAAVRGRMKLAAVLAALAVLTSTKAWIWIAVVAAIFVFEQVQAALKRGNVRRLPAAVFAVPAVAVLVFLQLGFAPVSNSLARGSVEVLSAGARGSIPVDASGRLIELATTFGLAALPLFALGLIGLVAALRRPALAGGPAALRFLHVPSAVYLIAVFGLVAAGAYSGSHRYLYPALPALALSAAAVLDRQASPARLIAVAASAVLAVGFLPVFASFAAVNSGLIAAGKAAAGDQGVLVTDSPVAAFYSGKPPADITGSQSLPGNRDQAVEWIRGHEVTDLVLENISYYRGSAVFPDLVAGHTSALFSPLGDQSSYQVAGGKTVYAYRTAVAMQRVLPGIAAAISPTPGQGKTAPLAKGLTLKVDGRAAAGEGMGFGVPIVHYPDGWVYSRTATTVTVDGTWTRTYEMDEIGGDVAHGYVFVPIPSRGEVVVTYTVDATGISVSVRVVRLTPGYIEVGILNEESAQFNDFAADGSPTLVEGQFGNWVPVYRYVGAAPVREPRGAVVGARDRRRPAPWRARAGAARFRLGRARLPVPRHVYRRQLPHQHPESEVIQMSGNDKEDGVDVVLVYPQRAPAQGRHWIMPSLGLMYLSASLRRAGYSVRHIDHTFLERREVLQEIERLQPAVIGIYCMITMQDEALSLAAQVRGKALTIVGGPYPSGEPDTFVDQFDLVAVGEGEETIVQVMEHLDDRRFDDVGGLVFKRDGEIVRTEARARSKDMSELPLPYRGDIPNAQYITYWRKHWKDATTPLMSTRGCPFRCDFCHKSVFGDLFSARPVESVVAEMREISELGYDHIWMSDDLFTLNYKRTFELAQAIEAAHLPLTWECLSRVTHVDQALFEQMHRAGCKRIFFGIESGDEGVLKQMKKGITPDQARKAVEACVAAGIKAAGFFMVGYLGETTDSLIKSINFSSSLPLDYVSYTIAYPLPGTGFYERVRERRQHGEWHKVRHNRLLFNTDFSEHKLRAAIMKGAIQHRLNKLHLKPAARAFELATDPLLRVLR